MSPAALLLCFSSAWVGAMPGSDVQTSLKNAYGKDFWIEMVALPDTDPKAAHGAVVVDRPPADIAALMRDIDSYKTMFAQISDSKVTQRLGKSIDGKVDAYIIMPGGFTTINLSVELRHQDRTDDNGVVWIRQRTMGSRGNFKRYEVDGRISPLDQGKKSLVEFWVMVIPDIPFIPDSIIEDENSKFCRRVLRALKYKSTGVTYKPNDL